MSTPLIAIFVRHSEECKHADDELYRRCNCRKHLRWTQNGVQYRKTAGTRSWADAEQAKQDFDRASRLIKEGVVTRQEFDQART